MDLVTTVPIENDESILIAVRGELDLATHGELAAAAAGPLSARRPVILDLSDCSFIDSTGLREVLQVSRGVGENGRGSPIAIVTAPGSMPSELLALTGLDRHLNLFATVEDALAWLEASGVTAGRTAEHPSAPAA